MTDTTQEPEVSEAVPAAKPSKAPKTPKCDNHPHRNATRFTGNGAFDISLCEECTPPWFIEDTEEL